MSLEEVRSIVAVFLKKPSANIVEGTLIDKSAIHGSVLIHRMFAALSKKGYRVSKPLSIKTFGDLLRQLNLGDHSLENVESLSQVDPPPMPTNSNKNVLPLAIGIDIQEASELPNVPAFREDEFYRKNFSSREIEYCAQQSSPLLSFAGKFAAKEAIIKADHRLREKPFSEIEILNNAVGVPEFGDFSISISHSQTIAIAIAIRPNIATVSDT